MSLADNLNNVQKKIIEAAKMSQNPDRQIEVVAVTKTIPVNRMREILSLGVSHLGENKVQELVNKIGEIDSDVSWHMIGHLQRNKVKYIVDKVSLIHSVDSIPLLNEINRRAADINREIQCLIQVNVSGEVSKFGLEPAEVLPILRAAEAMPFIKIKGLMTMAPFHEDPEQSRDCFKRLHELYQTSKENKLHQVEMEILSMGMSNDFEIAVEEGSTMVRIGSALFGERYYG
jgi:PLP dependent protein